MACHVRQVRTMPVNTVYDISISLILIIFPFFSRVERPERASSDQRPVEQVPKPREAGPQRVGGAHPLIRAHAAADHRRCKLR
jgi:hypothetical protein